MKQRTRREFVVLVIGLLTATMVVLVCLWQFGEQIQYRWYLLRARDKLGKAREQVLGWKESHKPAEYLSGPLKSLGEDGEFGFRAIASLLEDEDPRVWVRTAELLDAHYRNSEWNLQPESVDRVLPYVRSQGQKALLRYLILPFYAHGTEWRRYGYFADGEVKHHWCWYWSGKENHYLRPSRDGVSFCEDVLFDRFSYDGVYHEPETLKLRALDALVSMWRPEPGGENREVFPVLKRFLQRGDPEPCLHAINRLAARSGIIRRESPRSPEGRLRLSDWEVLVGICPPNAQAAYDSHVYWGGEEGGCPGLGDLTALFYVDHPRVLRVVARLAQDTTMKEKLDACQNQSEEMLPFRKVRWLPVADAARRYLGTSSRATGILCLAECQGRNATGALEDALAEEKVEDLRMLLKCCLFSLGERRYADEAKHFLSDLLQRTPQGEKAEYPPWDCVAQMLRSGDRQVLDRVVDEAIKKHRPDLLFALNYALEGFPLRKLLESNLIPFTADEKAFEGGEEALAKWWKIHRQRVSWDALRRVYVVGK